MMLLVSPAACPLRDDDLRHWARGVEGVCEGLESDAHLVDVILQGLRFREAGVTVGQSSHVSVSLALTDTARQL